MISSATTYRPAPNTFLAIGEGQTQGNGNPESWPTQLAGIGTMGWWNVYNTAVGGDLAAAIVVQFTDAGKPYWPTVTRVPSVLWVHAGPPDMENGATGASVYDIIAPMLASAKSMGFNVGVTQNWYNTDYPNPDAQFAAYNSLVDADPRVAPGLVFDGHATFPTPGVG